MGNEGGEAATNLSGSCDRSMKCRLANFTAPIQRNR